MAQSRIAGGLLLLILGLPTLLLAEDVDEIRKLIPAASAMKKKDFERMATSATALRASDFADRSLTLALFALERKGSEQAKKEFRFLSEGLPQPAELAGEVYRQMRIGKLQLRVPVGPITVIHADRITDVTCRVEGTTARGTVSFEVPKMYRGLVQYVARQQGGKWQIVEFQMPACGIHLVRDGDLWKQRKEKPHGDP